MNPDTTSFKSRTSDWGDYDYTAMELAISLGLMTDETTFQVDAKHVFWSAHPIGDFLRDTVYKLEALGVIERKETEGDDLYRWNPTFVGSWEKKERG